MLVRVRLRSGDAARFFPDEIAELIEPLARALSVAGPHDDIVLRRSAARRKGGVMIAPLGITARQFVEGDALHLIVHDARLDFVNAYIGSRIAPTFTFGSSTQGTMTAIQTMSGASRRADCVTLPLAVITGTVAVPSPIPTNATVAPSVAPSGSAPAAKALPAQTSRARDAAIAE